MTPEQFQRIDALFNAACGLEAQARPAFLDQACGDDAAVRAEVEALLAFDTRPKGYLKTPALAAGLQFSTLGLHDAPGVRAVPPERVGAYRIQRLIGEGGFGCVYLAEQDNPRRTVAVKLLKPRAASPSVLKRFEYEAQVLARLQHPGIAQVYEAGVTPGPDGVQAWFAMEHVHGRPLDADALARKLDVRQRLALLAQVCDAISYAHQKGVIHRDLKPANILVDEHGRPRILDFGVARTTEQDHDLTTVRSGLGQLIGTLSYMSPEQVVGDPAEVDTRSDVYALGVILYQLLTGVLPHDFSTCSIAEAARRIRYVEPPRLGALDREYRGEIEAIAAKAMAKDKNERYRSAASLGDDLRRYLSGQPIEARRDSRLYIMKKNLRRFRGVVLAAALFVATLALFGAVSFVQAQRNRALAAEQTRLRLAADSARGHAEQERQRADETAARRAAELTISNIERGRLFGLTGDVRAAEALLWREHLQRPDSPHTYWALWELYARTGLAATVRAHSGDVFGVAYSPDDALCVTAGGDGRIKLWDTRTWENRGSLDRHRAAVYALAFSPDGRRLASSAADGQVLVWDLVLRQPEYDLEAHRGAVRVVRFSPDGRWLLSGGDDGLVWFWDLSDGTCRESLRHGAAVSSLAFAPDGERVATSGADAVIRLWRCDTFEPCGELRGHTQQVGSLSFTPDGGLLVSGSSDRTLKLWDPHGRMHLGELRANNGTVRALRISHDGGTLVTAGWWMLDIWDLHGLTRRVSQPLHASVQGFDLSADGNSVAWGAVSGHLRVFEINPDAGALRLPPHFDRCSARFGPDGRIVATGDTQGTLRLWRVPDGRKLAEWPAHRGRLRELRFTPEGRFLFSGGEDSTVRVWDLRDGGCAAEFGGHRSVTALSYDLSPDGRTLAYYQRDSSLRLVDWRSGEVRAQLPPTRREALSVAFSPDGRWLCTTSRDGQFGLWDAETLAGSVWKRGDAPWCSDFTPDGERVVLTDWDGIIDVWQTTDPDLIQSFPAHTGAVWSLRVRPGDPGMVASASSDGTVKLWDLAEERCLVTFDRFDGWDALTVDFDPSGRWLLAAGAEGQIQVWDLAHFDRHIAENAEHQAAIHAVELGSAIRDAELAAEVDRTRRGAWPRQPVTGGGPRPTLAPVAESSVTAEMIARWGGAAGE